MTSSVPPNRRWIWPFELMEQIGEGGMGVVYRARYVVNNREVAVKMLPADVSDKIVLARFERELEVLKSLKHPNIVRCFGGLCEDKGRFYAMELVTGGTLESELQKRGRLPWEMVIQYGLQMCEALEFAHRQGVVHRDVKPSNFLLTPEGQLKLGDFGLAMMAAARKITQAGKTAGTFLYMAPEQIRGQEVTRRTDLYALGCVFYELLTGRPPFVSDTPAATLHMHLKSPAPRVSQMALDCPAALDQIVARLMEKAPADRFDTAENVAQALRMVTPTITLRSPKRPLTVADRNAGQESVDQVTAPMRRAIHLPPFPFWLTAATFAGFVASTFFLLQNWSKLDAAKAWEASWIEALKNPDSNIRIFAIRALGESREVTVDGMTAVSKLLTHDKNAEVRLAAAIAMGDAGAASRPLIPALIREKKENTDSAVRTQLEESIKRINDSPARINYARWFLTAALLIGSAAAAYLWHRSLPREVNADE